MERLSKLLKLIGQKSLVRIEIPEADLIFEGELHVGSDSRLNPPHRLNVHDNKGNILLLHIDKDSLDIKHRLNDIPIFGDPVADHWVREIVEETELTVEEVITKVKYIQENGRGCLTSTNSTRVPLAHIAEDYGVKLIDGSWIQP